MKIIVDEISKQNCPFYASKDWENDLNIEYEKGGCVLDVSPCGEVLNQWNCSAEKGDKECPFCITYDEFKRRMEKQKDEN